MKLIHFSAVFTIGLAIILFLKMSGAVSFMQFSTYESAYTSMGDDAAEKEEKKMETEYISGQLPQELKLQVLFITTKKIIIPADFFNPNYYPEVLTPPPSVQFILSDSLNYALNQGICIQSIS